MQYIYHGSRKNLQLPRMAVHRVSRAVSRIASMVGNPNMSTWYREKVRKTQAQPLVLWTGIFGW
jgi:hypothetical protein